MLHNFVLGLTTLGALSAIGYLVAGSMLGMFLGVIPGLGGPVVLSIILAFIYHIDVTGTLCLFLGTHAGSYFSASVTSILLNTPAHPEAFAVTFDGFPMAQHGQAGRALGISATSTCIGGLIGCAVLVGFIQIINHLPTLFHPPEYVALVMLALLLVGTLGTDSVSQGPHLGGHRAHVALDRRRRSSPATFRYTFNAVGLYGGVSLVALGLGLVRDPADDPGVRDGDDDRPPGHDGPRGRRRVPAVELRAWASVGRSSAGWPRPSATGSLLVASRR